MKPYYSKNGITIYHGDNREIIRELFVFDLLLTDPPYGLAKKLEGGSWGKKFAGNLQDWDAETVNLNAFLSVSKRQIVWGGNYYPLPPSRCWLIWAKPERGLTMADAELAWTNQDANTRVFECIRNPAGKRVHPTQKPIRLMEWCINQFRDIKTIIDPFGGACTTAIAARNLGRECVIIEREEQYCEAGASRLEKN